MTNPILTGIIRHFLTAIGGVLLGKGYIDASQLDILTGAGATLVGTVWSIFKNKRK